MKNEAAATAIVGAVVSSFMLGVSSHALEWHESLAWLVPVALFVRGIIRETR